MITPPPSYENTRSVELRSSVRAAFKKGKAELKTMGLFLRILGIIAAFLHPGCWFGRGQSNLLLGFARSAGRSGLDLLSARRRAMGERHWQ